MIYLIEGEVRSDGPFWTQKNLSKELIVQFEQYYAVYVMCILANQLQWKPIICQNTLFKIMHSQLMDRLE